MKRGSHILPVMESFYSIQGEGYHSGKPAYFVRLAGCNVKCTWCDVKDSWHIHENQFIKIEEIVDEEIPDMKFMSYVYEASNA